MPRLRCLVLCIATLAACGDAGGDRTSGTTGTAPDTAADTVGIARTADPWPASGPIDYRAGREIDLDRDGRDERVIASAHGPSYDSLEVAITIERESGDTLWHESWPSLLYFRYSPLDGEPDTTVARIVRDHVEQLLAPDRFTASGGLPAVLRGGGDPESLMREALHYHLAELDYRRAVDLSPADPTPPEGHGRIRTGTVPQERVDAVLADVAAMPSYMYYAGGEATYVIAWSAREESFVRIFACC